MADEQKVKVCYFDATAEKRKCNEIPKPVLYSAPGCPWCAETRGRLRGLGVPFTEISVTDQNKLGDLVKVSGQTGTPTLVVGKKVVIGHDPRRMYRALGIKRRR